MTRARFVIVRHAAEWRSGAVETLVWTWRLAGWLGLASLAQAYTSGPLPAFLLVAVWIVALGTASAWVGRIAPARAVRRVVIPGAGLAVSGSLFVASHGGGAGWLLPAILGWASLVALGAAAANGCGVGPRRLPVRAAAAGALISWAALGDIGDVQSLVPRLIGLVVVTCGLLALLLPRRSSAGRDPAGVADCSLPAWSGACWHRPRHWPVGLASFAMLPMMCSLPWMVSLCRSEAVSAQAVLGVHLAAMFLPALFVVRSRAIAVRAPLLYGLVCGLVCGPVCGLLLVLGAVVLLRAPGGGSWAVLATAHGAAWSVSMAVRSGQGRGPVARSSAWRGALLSAACCVALGAAVAAAGLQALQAWPVALGAAALASFAATWLFARPTVVDLTSSRVPRTTPPRPARRPGDPAPARRRVAAL